MAKRRMGSEEWTAEVAKMMVELQRRSGVVQTYTGLRQRDEHGNVMEEKPDKAA